MPGSKWMYSTAACNSADSQQPTPQSQADSATRAPPALRSRHVHVSSARGATSRRSAEVQVGAVLGPDVGKPKRGVRHCKGRGHGWRLQPAPLAVALAMARASAQPAHAPASGVAARMSMQVARHGGPGPHGRWPPARAYVPRDPNPEVAVRCRWIYAHIILHVHAPAYIKACGPEIC